MRLPKLRSIASHLKRYIWIYDAGVILLFISAFLMVYSQYAPGYDAATLRRLAKINQNAFIAEHPYFLKPDEGFNDKLPRGTREKPFYRRINGDFSPVTELPSTPAMRPDLLSATLCTAPVEKYYDDMTSQSYSFGVFSEDGKRYFSSFFQDGLGDLFRLRISQADCAIRESRWDDAMKLLRSMAMLSGIRSQESVSLAFLSALQREQVYAAYARLLHASPSGEVIQTGLHDLIELRLTDPGFSPWIRLGEKQNRIASSMPYDGDPRDRGEDPSERGFLGINRFRWNMIQQRAEMLDAAMRLVRRRNLIKDPDLKAWADKAAIDLLPVMNESFHSADEFDLGCDHEISRKSEADGKWLTAYSVRRWLKTMIKKEPWVYTDSVIPPQEYKNLDKWTLMLLGSEAIVTTEDRNMVTRARVSATQGRMMEAGFAARLYRNRNGFWPKNIGDLSEFYPSLDRTTTSSVMQNGIASNYFLPLRLGELPMNNTLRSALANQVLSYKELSSSFHYAHFETNGNTMVIYPSPGSHWLTQPVLLLALEQTLREHPRMVEHVDVRTHLVTLGKDQPMPVKRSPAPTMPDVFQGFIYKDEEYESLNMDLARRITDETDLARAEGRSLRYSTNDDSQYSGSNPTTAAQQTVQRIDSARIEVKLRSPASTTVIWSPGPDGKDDNAQIIYDPTNGTVSAGDLVAFPEEF